ncbi:MAG TPA: hypothetical protein DDW45_01425 [Gammaproteobacteria bacterium]|nr:hypothetical protein [Gammaproteobacteria bacterium]
MATIRKITLDVLKPHRPNALEFAAAVADLGQEMRVQVIVDAVDEKTESVLLVIEGGEIDFDAISQRISELGATLHSIDAVEVVGTLKESSDAS